MVKYPSANVIIDYLINFKLIFFYLLLILIILQMLKQDGDIVIF